jgi:hypothetical protein
MTEKEIAQALRCCQFGEPCDRCQVVSDQNCVNVMHKCAADLIERLTAENAALREKQAEAEAERDALLEQIKARRSCLDCKHCDSSRWEWRGLPEAPEEGGKTDA